MGIETPELKVHETTASHFISGDYFNTYAGAILHLRSNTDPRTIRLDTFSERYPNMAFQGMSFSVNTEEEKTIVELDRLTTEAKRLFAESTFDQAAFGRIAKQVALVCNRSDIAERLSAVFGE